MSGIARRELPEGFIGLWIPREIVELGLPPIQQMILAEVCALQGSHGCFASNAHFYPLVGVGDRSIRKHISALEDAGYLYAEGRDSARRRMWLASELSASIEGRKQRSGLAESKSTRNGNAEFRTNDGVQVTPTRHSGAVQPGAVCTNPESSDRLTRNGTATEKSMREQKENANKKPTGKIDSSNSFASTHLLDDGGRPLVLLTTWRDWLRFSGLRDHGVEAELHKAHLARMVAEGFDGDGLLREAMGFHQYDFWSHPLESVVPAHLKAKYHVEDSWEEGGIRGDDDEAPF